MILELLSYYKGNSIIYGQKIYDFTDLTNQVISYKKQTHDNVDKLDSVIILSDYNFFSISLFIALSDSQINIVPLVRTTKSEDSNKILSSKANKLIEIDDSGHLHFKTLKNEKTNYTDICKDGNTGVILFSSGTTGLPKVMIQNLTNIIKTLPKPKRQRNITFLIFLMFDHIGGLNTLLNCLISGSTIVIPENRSPSSISSLIYKHKVTILPTSPTFLNLLLLDDKLKLNHLRSLRLITYGTERMPKSLLAKINNQLPSVKLLQTFGTSETGIVKTKSKSSDSLFFSIDDPNTEYKILNSELYLRTKTTITGYKNHENSNFKIDGWYSTGDLVKLDNDGFMKIIGRKNNIINVGGLKVLPGEVEEIINSVNGVLDCTVFSENNNILGNIVCASVVAENNIEYGLLKKEINKICRVKLDKYKRPFKILFKKSIAISKRGKKI